MHLIIKTITLFIFFAIFVFAQKGPSVHQIEYEKYKSIKLSKNSNNENNSEIVPLNKQAKNDLSKVVFGYYPDWEYLNSAHNNFRYDLLTHIAAFDFTVSASGQISNPAGWPWTNVINDAHENGVKVIMVAVNFNSSEIHGLLTNSFTRWAFMVAVQSKIKQYNLDGVNVDFEGLNSADRGVLINEFMQELSDSVHSIDPELEVSFAAPAVNWGGWQLNGLAMACDYLFIMGYDFYGSWSTNTGPTAPLLSGSAYNVTNTVNVEYATTTTFFPDKLILGVPYYGPHWTTQSTSEGSSVIEFQNSVRFREAQGESETHGTKWSNTFKNPWYNFVENSTNHQVWFDNDSSLGLKYDLAIKKNLKGIGMWALGYDGTRDELWNLIEEKFSIPVKVENTDKLPSNFVLNQNYPNPFNPTTTIGYTIPTSVKSENANHALRQASVKIVVYDVLGREISTLVNEYQLAGHYEVTFNAENLPSGIYYYTLKTNNYFETKKMILLK
ncbi:MAG: T9SS type A sorting domain-containing protein [Ignavibacteriales bacterium]|nr:T9SS type A sorting domain-containing protein [Ignavibacteriales bacterium]